MQSVASYKVSEHRWDFINGSTLEFGYCDAESDVTKYQSAEYDVIRFDELTHFTESQFTYLISRIRGANPYPKQVKSTTNPGGIGHQWVKSRYIDPMPPDEVHAFDGETRLFLPARLADNPFLRKADAGYEKRLRLLSVHDTVFLRVLPRPAYRAAARDSARMAALSDDRLRSGYACGAVDRTESGRAQRGIQRVI